MINELTGNKDHNPLPDFVEEFAQFFLNKIDKIREQFVSSPTYHAKNKNVPKLDSFTAIPETNLYKLIMEMAAKLCELDTIPTKLLQKSSQTLHANCNQNNKPVTEYRTIS